jgi:hypothetical protein
MRSIMAQADIRSDRTEPWFWKFSTFGHNLVVHD